MGNPTSNNPSLDPLHKTLESLKEIRSALLPFLRQLKDDDDNHKQRPNHHSKTASVSTSKINQTSKIKRSRPDDDDNDTEQSTTPQLTPPRRAESEAAVALAIGTLRYMGARLRGLDRGRKKGDPLRMELDKIRGMLVALRKLEIGGADGKKGSSSKKDDKDGQAAVTTKNADDQNSTKQRKGDVTSGDSKQVSPNKKQRR
mmetsp:Transcript_38476/g.69347  ORF Transcript_38476/g.69347 Transcript_38476/m.69347 type:complete len:201 (-) Transcript_38476:239-841(-)|eukprot:CAMPEP_0201931616 /NCGR_PEP_ID=MMETSP0903-20130614/27746_1 /ASSEMBLY_ACC=CAM_ASM_000552 /TAXON_ID=420261 /ORGANISM="Thalassiosira antarctica, Strain CCMP982" /LENGTH=200 /DNA_ID=CAMNT_0048471001 /DNA_START=189 /DNA_END=791 /DNA_ORIENTATION=-